ncbi:AAA family ATPase [Paraburkholderia bannensis]|uniref:AAA family ATPase n=1 Tax=Paraburkholderia bannensis TaxID=765414 RepID=UPI002AB7DB03|nr:AAA family ATPase [Paraburkholderia bannensis]
MQILEWGESGRDGDERVQPLAQSANDGENWTTVVIGRNGTKKSALLRLILDAVLEIPIRRATHSRHARPIVRLAQLEHPADLVIAMAGTPFDRFPKQSIIVGSAPGKERRHLYRYLGLKAVNGAVGTTHVLRSLAMSLIDSIGRSDTASIHARQIFDFLGLMPNLRMNLRRHPSLNVSRASRAAGETRSMGSLDNKAARKVLQGIKDRLFTFDSEESESARKLVVPRAAIKSTVDCLARLPAYFEFNFEGDRLSSPAFSEKVSPEIVASLLAWGLLAVESIQVATVDNPNDRLDADSDLSSGQWQLLSSMLGLSLVVKDHSLILVDEPENSLHPEWQRAYVDLLSDVLSNYRGCHTVIATHSPLIASGIPTRSGNVIRLVPNADGPLGVKVCDVDMAYGWDASDVYHELFGMKSTRAPGFVEMTDRALELVRESSSDEADVAALRDLATELVETAKSLPPRDPMRTIVNAINAAADEAGGAEE